MFKLAALLSQNASGLNDEKSSRIEETYPNLPYFVNKLMNSNFLYLQLSNHNLEGARRLGIFLCDVTVHALRFDLENIDRKL